METSAPPIDERRAPQIVSQVESLLRDAYMADSPGLVPPRGVSAALIGIFARFSEIIIQRLNKVPEKNLLAFMDLLGASLLPPQPARVPLTFSLAAGSIVDGLVPTGTQVAAPPGEGESSPTVFETETELVVTAAQLDSLFVRDPVSDRYSDRSRLAGEGAPSGLPVFQGETIIEHLLYLGHSRLLGLPNTVGLTLTLTFAAAPQDGLTLLWEVWDGTGWKRRDPKGDKTAGAVRTIVFSGFDPIPVSEVDGVQSRWMRARLVPPIAPGAAQQPGSVRADLLPTITSMTLTPDVGRSHLSIETAFANAASLDLSKDYYPFGEKPKFNDTLYLGSREAFSGAGATIALTVTLTNPKDAAKDGPLPKTRTAGNPELVWEYFDGNSWALLGKSVSSGDTTSSGFKDTTQAFTKSGVVTLALPDAVASLTFNGVDSSWLRVRLVSGNYGEEAKYVPDNSNPPVYTLTPASFAPPSIKSIEVGYSLPKTAQSWESVKTYNDFTYATVSAPPFSPFRPTADTLPALHFGFVLPSTRPTFPNRPLSLFFRVADLAYTTPPDNPSATWSPRLAWEAWSDGRWTKLTAQDETEALTRSGVVELLPPAGMTLRSEFGCSRYWLRARWDSGEYRYVPRVSRVVLNTVMATQAESVLLEVLGSSNGGEGQRFQTARHPVLASQSLEVRELEVPAAEERAVIEQEEGTDAVSVLLDPTGRPTEVWVRWHEVVDFYGSGPRSRHYVLNHLTGDVGFGDGLRGLIPPLGGGNIRLAAYKTGGGSRGNKPAGAIVQLKTTIPYVDKVTNLESASGGAEAEQLDALLQRAPRMVRHLGRAVTLEDYEDLARLASPEVARARCAPLRNLTEDPLDEKSPVPGAVSVVIVPRSTEPQPQPSVELVSRVLQYLRLRSIPTTEVYVVGPFYLRVDVTVEIALTSLDATGGVEQAVLQRLVDFLHPLTGGLDGSGWDFGREPHASDLYALLGEVPGVDHINALTVQQSADPPSLDLEKVKKTGRFLVFSGAHTIRLVF